MVILTKKKQNRMLQNLANLLAIQNDYVLPEDKNTVIELYCALANGLDKKHGGDKLINFAGEAFKVRHPDFDLETAKNSDSPIGGEEK